jgi:hypothetical protein
MSDAEQLTALAWLHEASSGRGPVYWLFGGCAVDFQAGRVCGRTTTSMSPCGYVNQGRIASLLSADGWQETSETAADGYIAYRRGAIRLEVAFLERGEEGACTHRPGKAGPTGQTTPSAMTWPSFEVSVRGSSASPRSKATSSIGPVEDRTRVCDLPHRTINGPDIETHPWSPHLPNIRRLQPVRARNDQMWPNPRPSSERQGLIEAEEVLGVTTCSSRTNRFRFGPY